MRRSLIRKLCGKSGETITETLVALLISALALTMLAGAIAGANRVITRSDDRIQAYYAANKAMVQGTSSSSKNINVTLGSYKVVEDGKQIVLSGNENKTLPNTPVYRYTTTVSDLLP